MIEIDEEVLELLKRNAEPLVDTPNTVLRALLGLDANGNPDVGSQTLVDSQAEPAPGRQAKRGSRSRKRAGKSRRAKRGTLLPEAEYELPILKHLDQHGGRAPSREVVEAVGIELTDRLTAADHETLRSGDVRWKNRAAFVRLRLVEGGDLASAAPRGTWQITDQGRQRVRAES